MSPVKTVREQYGTAINTLSLELGTFFDDMNALRQKASLDAYRGFNAGDPSTGRVVTEFEAALDREKETLDLLIGPNGYWQDAYLQLHGKLNVLVARKRWLDEKSAEEDATGKEFTYSDIPF